MATATSHSDAHDSGGAHGSAVQRAENYKFATWLYLASEVVIFTVFIAGYVLFRFRTPEEVHEVHSQLNIWLVTANTFLLLTSSWAMVMGLREIQRNNRNGLLKWFALTAFLGVVFMGGQYLEYKELAHLSITLGGDAYEGFGMRFYVPTFFHGVHVFIGVIWCLLVMNNARRGGYNSERYVGVEVFGLYWHFVDVVWIVLFTLIYLV